MGYEIKARYYAEKDNFGESYVVTSDGWEEDTNLEIGETVYLNEHPMKKDPFEWMRDWLTAYQAENSGINVKKIMDWIFEQPMQGG